MGASKPNRDREGAGLRPFGCVAGNRFLVPARRDGSDDLSVQVGPSTRCIPRSDGDCRSLFQASVRLGDPHAGLASGCREAR